MSEITEAKAIELSRKYFDLKEPVLASVWKVTNLNDQDNNYFLVIFGEIDASLAIATVKIKKGDLGITARLSGTLPHLNISKEKALELSNSIENAPIELVWKPGKLSLSQLYPIWKVDAPSGILYINQEGIISDKL
ncbi:MAG: hypothetical protein QM763_16630 [Agriterribacter sp.]